MKLKLLELLDPNSEAQALFARAVEAYGESAGLCMEDYSKIEIAIKFKRFPAASASKQPKPKRPAKPKKAANEKRAARSKR